jgi:hypothetical protein
MRDIPESRFYRKPSEEAKKEQPAAINKADEDGYLKISDLKDLPRIWD